MAYMERQMKEREFLDQWKKTYGVPYASLGYREVEELTDDEVVCHYGHIHMEHFTECPYCTEGKESVNA